jgi:hypothetical protein
LAEHWDLPNTRIFYSKDVDAAVDKKVLLGHSVIIGSRQEKGSPMALV